MNRVVLVDTGPIVALLSAGEPWHPWTVEQFSSIEPPLLACEPVLAEADYLVRRAGQTAGSVVELVKRGALRIGMNLGSEAAAVAAIQTKYHDRPASLADACLVRMAEIYDDSIVMTFDGDFDVYRRHGRRAIPLLRPER